MSTHTHKHTHIHLDLFYILLMIGIYSHTGWENNINKSIHKSLTAHTPIFSLELIFSVLCASLPNSCFPLHHVNPSIHREEFPLQSWICWILSTPSQFYYHSRNLLKCDRKDHLIKHNFMSAEYANWKRKYQLFYIIQTHPC